MEQAKSDIYAAELAFLRKKLPTLGIAWETRHLIEQIVSPLMPHNDAKNAFQKMYDTFLKKAGLRIHALIEVIMVDQRKHAARIVVSVKLLREIFGDEIDSGQGGGGKKFKVQPNPISRMGRF